MRIRATLMALATALFGVGAVQAQSDFPAKPIRLLVGYPPGSGSDLLAREIAQRMSLGQSIVVDNRSGASGMIASEVLARSTPDGHTLGIVSIGHTFMAPFYAKMPYDTLRDFAGISMVADVPQLLVVSPALRIKTVRELIDLSKAKPGQTNYASAGVGSSAYINAELFNLAAGIKVVHVPFKGMAEALTSTISGNVQYVFSSLTAAVSLVKAERVTALGVSTRNRSPALPDVPSISEALPGFEFSPWYAILAPARTPKPVKDKLSKEIARVLALPDVRERLAVQGATPRASEPEKLDEVIREDIARMAKLIKAAGIRAD